MGAAEHHDVWVITRRKNAAALTQYLMAHPFSQRIHLEPLDLSRFDLLAKNWLRGLGLQIYYERWQLAAGRLARSLDKRVGFDVVHHVTFSADWSRVGVATADVPFVWGPVGGGIKAPLSLLPSAGWRGLGAEIARRCIRALLRRRRSNRHAWQSAQVVLVQNVETGRLGSQLAETTKVRLLPNSTAVDLPVINVRGPRSKEILVVGRLIPWKGGSLALKAFRRVSSPGSVLVFIGDGPELRRLQRIARRWRLADRVQFHGSLPRSEVVDRVARAGALLHLAFHEENSMAVAEALSLGTPVVCLDWGGPAELVRQWPTSPAVAVPVGRIEATAAAAAAAIDRFLRDPPPILTEKLSPRTSFSSLLMSSYDEAISQGRGTTRFS
jgi:glycosyltransferase involved in cell wall biosynthesis